jgi:hypothetical protein
VTAHRLGRDLVAHRVLTELCCGTIVVVQRPAQPLAPLDRACVCPMARLWADESVPQPLMIKRLAEAEGIDATDAAALLRMDRKRKKKSSNEAWQSPSDQEAEITTPQRRRKPAVRNFNATPQSAVISSAARLPKRSS